MAVRIRLKRLGRRNRPFWRLCATDKRAARDGRVIEELGWYDPHRENTEKVEIKRDRVIHWLKVGATPSETVQRLLLHSGIDPKGNEIEPVPWPKKKKKAPPPPAAERVAEETAAEAEAAPKAEAEAAPEAEAPAEAATDAEPDTPTEEAAEDESPDEEVAGDEAPAEEPTAEEAPADEPQAEPEAEQPEDEEKT